MRLLALDPGEITGWSMWFCDAITPLRPEEHGQISGGVRGFVDWWLRFSEKWGTSGVWWDEVVSESFILDGRTMFPNVTPLKIEGALEVLHPGFTLQRNTMKSHMPDAKIKSLGFWWPGEPHAVDSMRHAFAYMKLRRHAPTVNMLYPDPGPQLRLA